MQGTSQTCDNGDVILNVYSLQVEGMDDSNYSSYTSQLNITYSTSLIGSTVVCEYDNGIQVTPIGSKIITSNAKCMHNYLVDIVTYYLVLLYVLTCSLSTTC